MAKRTKSVDVQKFGGHEHIADLSGNVTDNPLAGVNGHSLESIEVESDTKIEDDTGTGRAVVMRTFTFKVNLESFKLHIPTKQDIFNGHFSGIEMSLWRDGLVIADEYEPHLLFNKKKSHYTIFVVATPRNGQTLLEKTQTLNQIING